MTPAEAADTVLTMNEPALPINPLENSRLDRLQAVIEVLLLSGLVSGFFAAIPFSIRMKGDTSGILTDARLVAATLMLEAAISFILLWLILRVHRESLRSLGLHFRRWRADLIVGVGLVPMLFLANILVTLAFRHLLPKYYLDHNPLTEIIRSPLDLGLFITSALVAGGIKEELQRGFILTRFRQHLGGSGAGLVIWSLAFGAQHYVQGVQGVVAATLFGFIFGAVYLARSSLLAPIITHGVYDTAALLGYWFSRGSS